MFERELVLNGLKRQNGILEQLLTDLEVNQNGVRSDLRFCQDQVRILESNLKKLRRIKKNYELVQEN